MIYWILKYECVAYTLKPNRFWPYFVVFFINKVAFWFWNRTLVFLTINIECIVMTFHELIWYEECSNIYEDISHPRIPNEKKFFSQSFFVPLMCVVLNYSGRPDLLSNIPWYLVITQALLFWYNSVISTKSA